MSKGKTEPGADATPWTMSVPAAGKKYFALGKHASYQNAYEVGREAPNGRLIPIVRAGRLMRALPRKIERDLAGA
jgi:hypothetical protein